MPPAHTANPTFRRRLIVQGQVQGVGFRPCIFRLAEEFKLTGFVQNTPEGVVIEVQGQEITRSFREILEQTLPPLARITSLSEEDLPALEGESGFRIIQSTSGQGHFVLISPEVATCHDCLTELFDEKDRRFLYPFINCTNCGPRFTITRSIPYDRPMTSMACFPLCPDCQAEYDNPRDRRFHAQPNACPICGPRVWLTDKTGQTLHEGPQALKHCARLLLEGRILAIKGLGGFHLVCNALDHTSVTTLRRRKNRWGKPLAVMVPNLETARMLARLSPAEEDLLSGRQRPIVLCRQRDASGLSPEIAPDTHLIGIMLPYTPLHHVLLRQVQEMGSTDVPAALVMTSGNFSSEPIALGNREALNRLNQIADYFLLHNRDILIRCDDSVVRVHPESSQPEFFRRARGFTPSPVFLPEKGPSVLGVGPQLKSTICLTKNDQAFVSQHIGDLENLETFSFFEETVRHLQDILQTTPELMVADLHPDYLSTRFALEQTKLPVFQLQHHFAHIFAILAEHKQNEPILGLALDGTGLGTDQTLWGGEALVVDPITGEGQRLASFMPVRLPGGEAAIREPWRIAQSYLYSLGILEPSAKDWPWLADFGPAMPVVTRMLEKNINSPKTTSCGRLFDAVAGLLGLQMTISYEGQAAIVLEKSQTRSDTQFYPCPLDLSGDLARLDTLALFAAVHEDWQNHVPAGVISRRFHRGLIHGLAELASLLSQKTGLKSVGLSGGVMQNATFSLELPQALRNKGLTPLTHEQIPPNDSCISLGQALFGQMALRLGRTDFPFARYRA